MADLDASGRVLARDSGCLPLEDISVLRWKRTDYFAKWLTWAIKHHGVTWLACEEPHTGKDNVGTRHALHGLYTFCDVISGRSFDVPVTPISRLDVFQATFGHRMKPLTPSELEAWERKKKRKTTRTIMRCPTKSEVVAAVNARHAHEPYNRGGKVITSEDEADAVAALDMKLAELAGTGGYVAVSPATAKALGAFAETLDEGMLAGPTSSLGSLRSPPSGDDILAKRSANRVNGHVLRGSEPPSGRAQRAAPLPPARAQLEAELAKLPKPARPELGKGVRLPRSLTASKVRGRRPAKA